MPSKPFRVLSTLLTFALLFMSCIAFAQTENARISGVVTDPSGAVVVDAQVILTNVDQGTSTTTVTNHAGVYVLPSVRPGQYRMSARKDGFKTIDVLGVVVNVQDRLEENFRLQPGSKTESITVTGGVPLIDTEDATVSTVVDRNFAENLPLNGRSFQTLIDLTPGVTSVVAGGGNGSDSGTFSVNGQRAAANYWTVDGVSANAAASSALLGNQISGAIPVTSVLGGTNSLVPVDDMQEFRIQTSSFAAEFGRTPGAQVSIVTRSGSNSYHGSAFDYLRNDVFDANDWFNGYRHATPLPKAKERQNDFGGSIGGPILKSKTFFFFSYEGLRLRLPNTTLSTVPDLATRENAVPAIQPLLNAFPLPTASGVDLNGNPLPGQGEFDATYSNPATLNDYNLRVDHKLTDNILFFVRYNYSPSRTSSRAAGSNALSTVSNTTSVAQQLTSGATWSLTKRILDEFRFNYSRTDVAGSIALDDFGGAQPFSPVVPSPFSGSNSLYGGFLIFLKQGEVLSGPQTRNVQHQINLIDTITIQKGSHNIKGGIDYRRLTPVFQPFRYVQSGIFVSLNQTEAGIAANNILQSRTSSTILFENLGVFLQDTWRAIPRLTFTYGLRWDTDFAPKAISGPPLLALANFDPNDFSTATLAASGTSPFNTDFGNVAPRVGIAYQVSAQPDWEQVIRGGFGLFYDLATSETANTLAVSTYPYSARSFVPRQPFPLTGAAATPPPIVPPTPNSPQAIAGVDPNLKSPYTLQWNVAIEQGLGHLQSFSLSYVGAAGRRLLQSSVVEPVQPGQLNPAFTQLNVATNSATSDYHALQAKFERRLFKNLQVLGSYTWSHSIDTGSAGSLAVHGNRGFGADSSSNRSSSDFDIRHSFTLGSTYAMPGIGEGRFLRLITHGWSIQNIFQTHTAPPVDIQDGEIGQLSNGFAPAIRPDVTGNVPLFLYGSQYPGGKAINSTLGAAGICPDGTMSIGPFCAPPLDANFTPLRPGNLARNALRGFGLFQWDFGIHREFAIREQVKLQFRSEMFNILNHPNFAFSAPNGDLDISSSTFGRSSQMLGQYLGSGFGNSGLNALYQVGGPRSLQFALKLLF